MDRHEFLEPRRSIRPWELGVGTLACPDCDAPVSPGDGVLSPADPIGCPYCASAGFVRDFLSFESPSRPARVTVRIVPRNLRALA
jgi:hypothetical protein